LFLVNILCLRTTGWFILLLGFNGSFGTTQSDKNWQLNGLHHSNFINEDIATTVQRWTQFNTILKNTNSLPNTNI